MMRTYYIVEHYEKNTYKPFWEAHRRGILSIFGIYNMANEVDGTYTNSSANGCEKYLRNILKPKKLKVIRTVRIK